MLARARGGGGVCVYVYCMCGWVCIHECMGVSVYHVCMRVYVSLLVCCDLLRYGYESGFVGVHACVDVGAHVYETVLAREQVSITHSIACDQRAWCNKKLSVAVFLGQHVLPRHCGTSEER